MKNCDVSCTNHKFLLCKNEQITKKIFNVSSHTDKNQKNKSFVEISSMTND